MAGTAERVGGLITFKVDGVQYPAKGSFKYDLGNVKRESIVGADGFHGYKETPKCAFIDGEITDLYDTDVSTLENISDSTIQLTLANGKTIVLKNAFYAGDGSQETDEGKIPVRFEAASGQEVS